MKCWEYKQKHSLPFEAKKVMAKMRAQEFYEHLNGNVFCSVGGLDSITLLLFLRKYVSKDIPGVSVSSLEDKSIKKVHRQLDNMTILKPLKSKVQVIKEYGYPVISKSIADKIELIQNPTEKNATVRNAIVSGQTGDYGGNRFSRYMRLSDKWQRLFIEQQAPFRVSGKCCYYMKERPCDIYSKETGRSVYMALMIAEGGRRAMALMQHGCNYYGKTVTRSCPFAFFSRQDILYLALELGTPVPAIYGEIKRQPDGTLETTRARRTGCTMCGFGIHMENRPHRFDRLRHDNLKEWAFWMYDMGWGKVLDYIGIPWETEVETQGVLGDLT